MRRCLRVPRPRIGCTLARLISLRYNTTPLQRRAQWLCASFLGRQKQRTRILLQGNHALQPWPVPDAIRKWSMSAGAARSTRRQKRQPHFSLPKWVRCQLAAVRCPLARCLRWRARTRTQKVAWVGRDTFWAGIKAPNGADDIGVHVVHNGDGRRPCRGPFQGPRPPSIPTSAPIARRARAFQQPRRFR